MRSKIETAKEYQHDRKFSKSIEIYSDILKNKGLLTEENRIAIYKEIINCVRESKLYDDMEKYTNTLIGFIRANDAKKYKSSLAWAFMQKGQIYYYKNNSKNAIKYFKKAQDEYTDEEDKAWALSWLGYTYYSKKSDYAYASKIFKKSLQKYLDQNISQDERVAYLYSRIGNSKGRLGNFNDAIENTNKAIAIYEQINKNNKYNSDIAWCYNILGLIYDNKPDPNLSAALKNYKKACKLGNTRGCYSIGVFYRDGIGVNRDIEKAIEYLFPLAKKDFLDAREALADIYYDMEDSYKTEAFKWYKLAAQKDQGWSEYRLGYMYEYAEGTPRDINKSIYWYKKSIKDGVFDGAENLADIYYYDRKDYNLAFHYYKITVDNNVSDRNYDLGYMYEHGEGIDKDRDLAFLHYEKSAKNGNSASQCKLAKAYKNGDLVGADVNKSKYWLRLFNENNDTEKGKCVLDSVCEDYDESLQNIIQSNQESMLQIKKLRKEIDKMIISTEIINPSEN